MQNNALQVFNYEGLKVRTVEHDGETWFVAKDVCDILEIANVTQAINQLDDDEKMTLCNTESHSGQRGGAQFLNVISESGVYALVFKSRKSEAKNFSRFVRREVLPSIRKTGAYVSEQALTDPEFVRGLLEKVADLQERNEKLTKQIESARPKTALGSIVYAMSGAVTVQDAANFLRQKGIPIGQNLLYKYLRDKKYLCSRKGAQWNKPTAQAMVKQYFNVEMSSFHQKCSVVVKVTPKLLCKLADDFTQEYLPIVFMIDQAEKEN